MKEVFSQGGPLIWIIALCGVASLAVYLERSLHLHRARIKIEDFLKGIANILRRGTVREALAICDETPGPVSYVVRTAIMYRTATPEGLRDHVREASLSEISRMERRLVVIATVAQIAPLLGLLGTILGMVQGLGVVGGQAPLVREVDLVAGLMRALYTSGAGLMVAIPSYAAFNALVVKIDRLVVDMERAASEVLALLQPAAGADGE